MKTTKMLTQIFEAQDYYEVSFLIDKFGLNRERVYYCLANATNFNHFCQLWAYSNTNYIGFTNQYTI